MRMLLLSPFYGPNRDIEKLALDGHIKASTASALQPYAVQVLQPGLRKMIVLLDLGILDIQDFKTILPMLQKTRYCYLFTLRTIAASQMPEFFEKKSVITGVEKGLAEGNDYFKKNFPTPLVQRIDLYKKAFSEPKTFAACQALIKYWLDYKEGYPADCDYSNIETIKPFVERTSKEFNNFKFMLFALGRHKRAGENSPVKVLVDDVVGIIAEHYYNPTPNR